MDETDPVFRQGAAELNEIAPGMLKQKIASLVFLPWLFSYTERVREAAKQEERQAILAELPDLPEEARNVILARGEPGWPD